MFLLPVYLLYCVILKKKDIIYTHTHIFLSLSCPPAYSSVAMYIIQAAHLLHQGSFSRTHAQHLRDHCLKVDQVGQDKQQTACTDSGPNEVLVH